MGKLTAVGLGLFCLNLPAAAQDLKIQNNASVHVRRVQVAARESFDANVARMAVRAADRAQPPQSQQEMLGAMVLVTLCRGDRI